jgi:hypothetical protein
MGRARQEVIEDSVNPVGGLRRDNLSRAPGSEHASTSGRSRLMAPSKRPSVCDFHFYKLRDFNPE